jgi:hypothetical protein
VYYLDYPQTENGVVLVSYTWGDDADKLLGLDVPTRFEEVLRNINPRFAEYLVPVGGEILSVDWEAELYFYGAFKLQYLGQEPALRAAYYQFLSVLDPMADTGVYLAGDGVSRSGGWTEGAVQTGVNAACAVAKRLGGIWPPDSPLSQDPNLHHYGSYRLAASNSVGLTGLLARHDGVRLAPRGPGAPSPAEEGIFDLLLLSIHIPWLDGFQVIGGEFGTRRCWESLNVSDLEAVHYKCGAPSQRPF